jgi:hypothetical protein
MDNLDAAYNRLSLRYQNTFSPVKKINITSGVYYTASQSTSGKNGYGSITSKAGYFFPYAQFGDENGNPLPLIKDYPSNLHRYCGWRKTPQLAILSSGRL